jgi:hypothetical protein
LSSLFINRSFNTFRSIQCEQFKEKLGKIRGWGPADRHFAAHYPYHCFYCKTTFLLVEEIIKHSTENHGSQMSKVKYLELNPSSDIMVTKAIISMLFQRK